jgi:hypothetical protein
VRGLVLIGGSRIKAMSATSRGAEKRSVEAKGRTCQVELHAKQGKCERGSGRGGRWCGRERDPNGKLYKRKLRDPYWQGRERAI